MPYTIDQLDSPRESFGPYRYQIFRDGELVATYWHDFRGDEHGIDFVNGASEPWPVGRMIEFLVGGGGQPFRLSPRAIEYLDGILNREG